MLKSTVLNAVQAAKTAVQDLAFGAKLVIRGAANHVPGQKPTYSETLHDIKIVPSKFEDKEIDGERIRATDLRWLVFPEPGYPIPSTNDLVRLSTAVGEFRAGDYRIVNNDKVMAGDSTALSQLQIRYD